MANIGNSAQLSQSNYFESTYDARRNKTGYTATQENEAITEFHIYTEFTSSSVQVAAYRIDTDSRIGSAVIDASDTSGGWKSVTGLNIPLPVGVEVRVGFSVDSQTSLLREDSVDAYETSAGNTVVPETWTGSTQYDRDYSFYAVAEVVTPQETLSVNQTEATYGDTLTSTASFINGTSAKLIDSSANELALINFINNGDGTYSFDLPDLVDGLIGPLFGSVSIELTNGTDTASDTLTLNPPTGLTALIATTQAASLGYDDWGYAGTGGLDNAVTENDVALVPTVAGLTFNSNGTNSYSDQFTGATVEFWIQDADDTRALSRVVATYEGENTADVTPSVFSFDAQTDVTLNSIVESNTITVSGVDSGEQIPVTITGGEYAVSTDNGSSFGGWTSTQTDVELDYQIKVRHLSSANHSTTVNTVLNVGGVTDTFTSTTEALIDASPTISLLGGAVVEVTTSQGWSEEGFSATDAEDGDLTADVVVTGSVDDTTAGTYYKYYNVSDSAGNTAEQVVRTVVVVDDTPVAQEPTEEVTDPVAVETPKPISANDGMPLVKVTITLN